jgi:ribosomal protein L18
MESKIHKLAQGKTVQFTVDELPVIYHMGLSSANMKKLEKANKSGKGVRISLDDYEIEGSGLKSMAMKAGKAAANNKQLRKLADQGINQGINYGLDQAGVQDPIIRNTMEKYANRAVNQQINLASQAQVGGSLKSMAIKAGKAAAKNKQLRNLGDKALQQGINYGMNEAGIEDPAIRALVNKTATNIANQQINQVSGSGLTLAEAYAMHKQGGSIGLGKVLKGAKKGLKIGNKISNALGYDDLDNMAIDMATQQTLGRIDPTLGNIAAKQLNRVVDKEMQGGSFRKVGGSFGKIGGALEGYRPDNLSIGTDRSNMIRSNHPANYALQDSRRYFA